MKKFLMLILMLSIAFILVAENRQESTSEDNSVELKIDEVFALQRKMYDELRKNPLENKKYGVELNLFRLLFFDENRTMSGTFSFFDIDRRIELALPFYFSFPKEKENYDTITLDCHYRYFLGNTQNGAYLSGFARFANLNGYKYHYYGYVEDKKNVSKFGIGVGVGYRVFSYKGLYWGTSLSFGRYIIGQNDVFETHDGYPDDMKLIFDFEFLKFGWAF